MTPSKKASFLCLTAPHPSAKSGVLIHLTTIFMRIRARFLIPLAALLLFSATTAFFVPASRAQTADPCPAPDPTPAPTPPPEPAAPTPTFFGDLHINELLVNPIGVDTEGEFIELWNPNDVAAELTGWMLVDGKAKTFALGGITIPADGYIALPYAQTRLTLTNTGGTMTLVDSAGTTRSSVTYGGTGKEGQSYARMANDTWSWVDVPTPGSTNEALEEEPEEEVLTAENDAVTDSPTESEIHADDEPCDCADEPAEASEEDVAGGADDEVVHMSELAMLADGTDVVLRGVVSLAPDRVGKTIFAIQERDGSAGTYIRMYGTDRPFLRIGDGITVRGKVSRVSGHVRITTGKDGVQPDGTAPGAQALRIAFGDLDATWDGVTVHMEGISEKTGKGWLAIGDGNGLELRAEFTEARTFGDIPKASAITVAGVLRYADGVPTLLADDATFRVLTDDTSTVTAEGTATTTESTIIDTEPVAAASPAVGGALALAPVIASAGVLGWKKWRGIPLS